MAVTTQILRSYIRPRAVMRGLIAVNRGSDRPEAQGFIYLLVGLVIFFVGQIPDLSGTGLHPVSIAPDLAGEDGQAPVEAVMAITLFTSIFVWPLLLYLLGWLSHLVARVVGGQGRGADARLALFWAVLAISPLFLLRGLGSAAQSQAMVTGANYAIAAGFLWIWLSGLYEAERPGAEGAA